MEGIELTSLPQIIRMAMRLNPAVYAAVQTSPMGIWVALIVVGLAGVSESLGQSVVLFVNKVRPRRFILALGISTVSQMIGFALWAVIVWLISVYVFGASQSFVAITAAVGLAYAPQLLAFFELTPFLGNTFAVILSLWSMVAIVVAVYVGTDLDVWQAILTSMLGWISIQIWRRSLGRPIYAIGNWMQRRAAGNPLAWTMQDVPQLRHAHDITVNWEKWRENISRSRIAEFGQQTLNELAQRLDLPNRRDDEAPVRGVKDAAEDAADDVSTPTKPAETAQEEGH